MAPPPPHTTTTTTNKDSSRLFELPTGQSIVIDRFKIAESIFDPTIYKFTNSKLSFPPNNGEISITQANEYRPLKRVRKMMMMKKKILINLLQNQKLILEVYHN